MPHGSEVGVIDRPPVDPTSDPLLISEISENFLDPFSQGRTLNAGRAVFASGNGSRLDQKGICVPILGWTGALHTLCECRSAWVGDVLDYLALTYY